MNVQEQIITIQDTTPPSFTVPSAITINCEMMPTIGNAGDVEDEADNCGVGEATFADAADLAGCNGTGTITRTWTLVDACGNMNVQEQVITVQDTSPPSFTVPSNITINCEVMPTIANTGDVENEADNCGVGEATFADVADLAGCNGTGTITRTWTLVDACGNMNVQEQIITIQDTTKPIIITCAPIITINCDDDPNPASTGMPTASDNCTLPEDLAITFTDSSEGGTCSGDDPIIRTWTISDACGNSIECTQSIVIQDVEKPSFTVPSNITINCEVEPIISITGDVTDAADNCALLSIEFMDVNQEEPGCNNTRIIERTWTALDICGNDSIAIQLITVQDTTPPTFTAPENITINCEIEPSIDNTGDVTDEADNCGVVEATFEDSEDLEGCNGTGIITRTWILVDACGNMNVQEQIITVQDTTPPTFTAPENITINCEIQPSIDNTGDVTDEADNCGVVEATFEDSEDLEGCNGTGTVRRTWTLIDACGNMDVQEQIITVQDTTRPVIITCNPSITISCDDDPDPSSTGIPVATDNCTLPEDLAITFMDSSEGGTCSGDDPIIRIWTISDACGNSVKCTQSIVIQDVEKPSFNVPSNITINCEVEPDVTITGNVIDATDNCALLSIGFEDENQAEPGCNNTRIIERTWTALDICGNDSIAIQLITVQDTTPPTFTVPSNITINCDVEPSIDNTGDVTDEADYCGVGEATFADTEDLEGCNGTGIITRTWTLVDACGNMDVQEQLITVQDTTPPTFTAPENITINCEIAPSIDNTGDVTDEADNCGVVEATFADVADLAGCNGTGTIRRTWTLIDACGNMDVQEQIITVQDTTRPVIITCNPSITISCDDDPNPSFTGMPTASDNCTLPEDLAITFMDSSEGGTCSGDDPIIRTWTISDACGNSVECTQSIVIQDVEKPSFTVPSNITINCEVEPIISITGDVTDAADNCALLSIEFMDVNQEEPGCNNTRIIERTWIALDICGNDSIAIQLITVQDTTPPSFTVPSNITINCEIEPSIDNTGDVIDEDDNCGVGEASFVDAEDLEGCNGTGTITRTWTLVDACGNINVQEQIITVQDTTPPTFTAPENITINCEIEPSIDNTGDVTDEADYCGVGEATFADTEDLEGCNGTGIITRTWTLVDACGNMDVQEQLITVLDTAPPSFTVPSNITINCEVMPTIGNTGDVEDESDNCGVGEATFADVANLAGCNGTGTITRTWTLVDACGNMNVQEQIITIQDTTKPVIITCNPSITISCDDDPNPASTGMPTASDNCTLPEDLAITFMDSSEGGTCSGDDPIIRIWTISDACGNSIECTQSIVIQDVEKPSFTVPSNITINCEVEPIISITGDVTDAADNCELLSIEFMDVNQEEPGCNNTRIIERTWIALDICGNDSIAIQIITVQDTTPPSFTAPENITINCDVEPSIDNTGDVTDEADNCGVEEATFADVADLAGCNGTGTITRTWTLVDACGNMNVQDQIITVQDTTPPTFTVPVNITINCDIEPSVENIGDVEDLLDNCGIEAATFVDVENFEGCSGTGIITRTWTLVDACGNMNTQDQIITVQDTTPPTFIVPANITINCDIEATVSVTGDLENEADNCRLGEKSFVDIENLEDCNGTGTITRIWTLADLCGNINIQEQIITVRDTTSPEIVAPTDVSIMCEDDPNDLTLTGEPSTLDNCTNEEGIMISYSDVNNIEGCASEGTITRTWTAVDLCGNTSTDVQTIFVEDVSPPEFMFPSNITINCFEDYTNLESTGDVFIMEGSCAIGLMAIYTDEVRLNGCNNTGTVERTWVVSDNCGNSDVQSQIITVEDEEPPVAICNDVTIFIEIGGNIDLRLDEIDNGSYDCGVIERSLSQSNFECDDAGLNIIQFIVEDECGNTNSCNASVFVIDTISPSIICPADLTVQLSADQCSAEAVFADPIGEDNCSFLISRIDDLGLFSGDEFYVGNNILSYEITDVSNNTASCSHEIFVKNFLPPAFACQGQINVSMDEHCEFSISIEDVLTGGELGCSDGYTIEVGSGTPDNFQNIIGSPIITCEYLGQDLLYSITDNTNNISCWGRVLAEDKLAPQLNGRNLEVKCDEETDPFHVGFPFHDSIHIENIDGAMIAEKGADNCSQARLSYFDNQSFLACDNLYSLQIIRNWTAIDDGGRTGYGIDTINMLRATIDDLELPRNFDGIDTSYLKCEDRGVEWDTLTNGHPSPTVTGDIIGNTCNEFQLTFEDLRFDNCADSPNACFKVLRDWKIYNWCSGEIIEHQQIIKILDDIAPTVIAPDDHTLGADSWCKGYLVVNPPSISDNCSDNDNYRVISDAGIVEFDESLKLYTISELQEGEVYVIYEAEDCCGNLGYDTTKVLLVDQSPPVAVCHENTIISLSVNEDFNGSETKLYASSIDNGSSDNCKPVWLKIGRMDDSICGQANVGLLIDDYASFCCGDIDRNNMVALRVFEVNPGEGIVSTAEMEEGGSLYGKYTDCMARVTVQDKLNPIIIPPSDMTVSCEYWSDEDNLDQFFGSIKLNTNIADSLFIFDRGCPDEASFDPADRYASYYKFVGFDGYAYDACDIEITESHTVSYGCNASEIIRTFIATDSQGNSSTTNQRITIKECIPFYIADEDCGNSDPLDGVAWPCDYITSDCNASLDTSITGIPEIMMRTCHTIGIKFNDSEYISSGNGCKTILREWRIIDECYFDIALDDFHVKEWRYYQRLRIENSEAPVFSNCEDLSIDLNEECEGILDYTIVASDDCTSDDLLAYHYEIDMNSDYSYSDKVKSRSINTVLPEGKHQLKWYAFDGCNNISVCNQTITVIDRKPPVAYCFNGITTSLNEGDKELEFWASDFDLGGYDECSNPVVVSFSPNTSDIILNISCNDLDLFPVDSIPITLWITDSYGNQDFCNTYLKIRSSAEICGETVEEASILGEITNHADGIGISNVEMYFSTNDESFEEYEMAVAGKYELTNLKMYSDYYLKPKKNDDVLNGVTTLDLVLIQKHILGTKVINNPYYLIASDVNHSGAITASDLLDLRKVILGIKKEFKNNNSWNFMPSHLEWIDIQNPWGVSDYTSVYDLRKDVFENFTGIKVGDVNGNVQISEQNNSSIRVDHSILLESILDDGQWNLKNNVNKEIFGLELSLIVSNEMDIDAMVVTSDLPEFTKDNYHFFNKDDQLILKVSWNTAEPIQIKDRSLLSVSGIREIRLHETGINEFYDIGLQAIPVKEEESIGKLTLHQNTPNPFTEKTTVKMEISEAGNYELSVLDLSGKTVWKSDEYLEKGMNSRTLEFSNLKSGIYVFKISSQSISKSIKMMVIN
ncbi:T9SS type A sorting domain-containing protein [Portibacter lacus]|nr:T9SS type A sorting domain-containing protein [Portibacter lacus]